MSREILWEVQTFLAAAFLGVRLALLYGGLCLLRILAPHRRLLRDLEDLLYWVFWAVQAWTLLYRLEDGSIRWFFLAGIGLGMIGCGEILRRPLKKAEKWVKMKKSGRKSGEKGAKAHEAVSEKAK